ncbi:hypothetical protein Ddc_15201 [Ditylenchus destructor]|nr:hypothetical protein Ddc_15201 [Ditylenchus destructor]
MENLKSDLGVAEDPSLSEFPTENRSPKIPENSQLLSNDQRSSVINPHTPAYNAPNLGSRMKRAPQFPFSLTALSPHLFPMAEFFPNNGGILHPVNYRG